MAKIDRYDGNLKAFAADATGTERTIFGDTAQSDTLDANITAAFLRGWGIVGVNENPTKQDFDGLGFTLGQLIAYLHQQGIPEWNTSQEYYQGSVVTTLAGIYRLKSGGDGTVDPDSDDGVNWQLSPTRAQVDAKAPQATTYTEAEVDSLLNAKAPQATTYTEAEVDSLLNVKADAVDVPLYQEAVVALGAPFTGNSDVLIVRIGKMVTITSDSILQHPTGANIIGTASPIPAWASPGAGSVSNAYYENFRFGVSGDNVSLHYKNYDGLDNNKSNSASAVTITYNVF